MSDVTQILSQIKDGDPKTAEQLLPLIYNELRRLAALRLAGEPSGQTLQPTALVHEAYIRLVDPEKDQHWDGRGHFFSAAAEAMRRILVDRARRRKSLKAGGGRQRVDRRRSIGRSKLAARICWPCTRPWRSSKAGTRARPNWSNCGISRASRSKKRRPPSAFPPQGRKRLGLRAVLAPGGDSGIAAAKWHPGDLSMP